MSKGNRTWRGNGRKHDVEWQRGMAWKGMESKGKETWIRVGKPNDVKRQRDLDRGDRRE